MEGDRYLDFAKVPGMIALATALGFAGSVVGNWIYFQPWDPTAFKLLTPGDFSTLAIPLILFVAPLFALLSLVVIPIVDFGGRRLKEQEQNSRDNDELNSRKTVARHPTQMASLPIFNLIQTKALKFLSNAASFILTRLRFLLITTIVLAFSILLFFASMSSAYHFLFENILARRDSLIEITTLSFYIYTFLIVSYTFIDSFLELIGISLPISIYRRASRAAFVLCFLSWFVGFLTIYQFSSFYRSLQAALDISASCTSTTNDTSYASKCIFLSLERGILYFDTRDRDVKFHFHNEPMVISFETPSSIPTHWNEAKWFKEIGRGIKSLDENTLGKSIGFTAFGLFSDLKYCREQSELVTDKSERKTSYEACKKEKREKESPAPRNEARGA